MSVRVHAYFENLLVSIQEQSFVCFVFFKNYLHLILLVVHELGSDLVYLKFCFKKSEMLVTVDTLLVQLFLFWN